MNEQLYEKRGELLAVYRQWHEKIKKTELYDVQYSYPYFLHIPDNWYESKYRFLIVGEEGYGEKSFDTPIEEAQKFNKEYMESQLGRSGNYSRSGSAFWWRIRKISELLPSDQTAMTWTNLDKIHRSGTGNCSLQNKMREMLHQHPILADEISVLNPTHIIYFGWYGISLEKELPQIYQQLYPADNQNNVPCVFVN